MHFRQVEIFPFYTDINISPFPILFFKIKIKDSSHEQNAAFKTSLVDINYDHTGLPPVLVQVSPGRDDHKPEWEKSERHSRLKFYLSDGWPMPVSKSIINNDLKVELKIDYQVFRQNDPPASTILNNLERPRLRAYESNVLDGFVIVDSFDY